VSCEKTKNKKQKTKNKKQKQKTENRRENDSFHTVLGSVCCVSSPKKRGSRKKDGRK
jgi:hypothetical protein